MNQKIKKIIKYFLVLVLVGVSVSALAQWTPPSTTPPGGNIFPPVNTGSVLQEKLGTLVAGLMQTNSQLFVGGSNFRIEEADSSPNAGFVRFGDNTGWKLHFGRSKESTSGGLNTGTTGSFLTLQDNARVGILTTDPTTALDINGSIRIRGGSPGAGKVLTSDANGLASWVTPTGGTSTSTSPWTVSGNNIFNSNTGTVSLRTDTVIDNAKTISSYNTSGSGEGFLWPRWSDNVTYLNYGSNGFNIRNNTSVNTMFMTNSGRVGIGTTNPQTLLDVNGSIKLSNDNTTCSSGIAGAQRYNSSLSSMQFCNGAAWVTLLPNSIWSRSGTIISPSNIGDNVGIGTVSPTNRLSVQGNANINGVLTVGEITNNGKVLANNVNTLVVNGGIKLLNHIGNTAPSLPICDSTLRGTLVFNADNGNQGGSGPFNSGDGLVICTYDRVSNTHNWRKI